MLRERERERHVQFEVHFNRTDIRVMKKIYIYQTRNITVEEKERRKVGRNGCSDSVCLCVCMRVVLLIRMRLSQISPSDHFLNKRQRLFRRSFRGAINIGT